jgi:hypothetical protein
MTYKRKRDSQEVDKLIAEAEKWINHPDPAKRLSVNKACAKVGLQTTVYYFRKRKDEALSKTKLGPGTNPVDVSREVNKKLVDNIDTASLMAEARELEDRLNQIKIRIAESMMKTF